VHLHANDREGGRLAYLLKSPLADGTEVLMLEPCELLRRLAALVPPPRAHLVRYYGVFAPASVWRSRIVPNVEPPRPCEPVRPDEQTPPSQPTPSRRADSRIPWANCSCASSAKTFSVAHAAAAACSPHRESPRQRNGRVPPGDAAQRRVVQAAFRPLGSQGRHRRDAARRELAARPDTFHPETY
jgi:hypothetical protein